MNSHHIQLLCSHQHLVLKGLQLGFQVLNFPAESMLVFFKQQSSCLFLIHIYKLINKVLVTTTKITSFPSLNLDQGHGWQKPGRHKK